MCRLCLATFTSFGNDTPIHYKSTVMHEMLMRASHGDGGQKDGWGVTDMSNVCKSVDWYFESVPTWTRRIDSKGWVLAHLRKASAGTQRTVTEAHPYVFETDVGRLIAAHNGFFEGTKYTGWANGQPGTDSYRALSRLAVMINEAKQDVLSADFISQWLSEFGEGSHYAVMLHLNDTAYVLRGKTRTMSALQVGDGYLFHTDASVLRFMRKYMQEQFDLPMTEEIKHLPDNMMATLKLGSIDVQLDQITPVHTRTVHVNVWENSSKTSAGAVASPNSGNEKSGAGDMATVDGYVVAPSVTRPLSTALAIPVANNKIGLAALVRSTQANTKAGESTLRQRKQQWAEITGKLSPLRKELALLWASTILGYEMAELSLGTFLRYTSPQELTLLDGIFFPRVYSETDVKYVKPFTPTAHMMINWWNHLVKDGQDVEAHLALFGRRFFWLDHTFTNMRKHDDSFDSALAMRAWTGTMIGLIANWGQSTLTRRLDTEKLSIIIGERQQRSKVITTDMLQ